MRKIISGSQLAVSKRLLGSTGDTGDDYYMHIEEVRRCIMDLSID
jgi:hypothetical protein